MELYENTKLCSMPITWIPLRIALYGASTEAESGLKSVRESCYYKRLKGLELFIVRLKARQMFCILNI
jgi:hypothetical protein